VDISLLLRHRRRHCEAVRLTYGGSEENRRREPALHELNTILVKPCGRRGMIILLPVRRVSEKTTLIDEFNDARRWRALHCVLLADSAWKAMEAKRVLPNTRTMGGFVPRSRTRISIQTLAEQAPTWLVQFPAQVKREHATCLQREILGATRNACCGEIGEASVNKSLGKSAAAGCRGSALVGLLHGRSSLRLARGTPPQVMVVGRAIALLEVIVSNNPLNVLKQTCWYISYVCEIALEPLAKPKSPNI